MLAKKTTFLDRLNQLQDETNPHNVTQIRTDKEGWFDACVKKGKSQPFSLIATITPDLARKILSNNDHNRLINERNVIKIASDIQSGLWALNGEAIIIADDGQLNDGQHRLEAVVLADAPIDVVLFFGASRDSRYTVDMGVARNTGHYLSMEGVKNANHIAAATKVIMIWKRGFHTNADHLCGTKQEVRAFFHENREIIEHANAAIGYTKFAHQAGTSSTVAAYAILHEINPSACEEFFEKLCDGVGLSKGSALLQARTHFLSISRERLHAWEKLELFIKYWNSWRRGRPLLRNHHVSSDWPKIEG